jgi:hypothetical protein
MVRILKSLISLEVALKCVEKNEIEQRVCLFCGNNVTDFSSCSSRYNIIIAYRYKDVYNFGACDDCFERLDLDDTQGYKIKFVDEKLIFTPDSIERGNE